MPRLLTGPAMSNAVSTTWPSGSANGGWPQEPTGMLMPGRIQGWPAGTQRAANPATTLLSQAVAWWDVEQYREGDRFLRNRGTGGELLDLRLGSAAVANSNDPRFLAPEDSGYVWLPGVANNYLSVPDEAALDITGDIDIRVRVALDDWTPAGAAGLVAKRASSSATTASYQLNVSSASTGTLSLFWRETDGTQRLAQSTTGTGITDGEVKWVRATLDVNNGAGTPQYEVKFWLSNDGASWTQLGSTITGTTGPTSIIADSNAVLIGHLGTDGTAPAAGSFYRAQILNGIDGTTVLDIDCDAITSGSATSFTASTNQTVTINRSTSGRKSVAVPSRHKGGKPVMLLGTDDYLIVPNETAWQHGLLNFGQGDSFTVLACLRRWGTSAGSLLTKQTTLLGSQGYGTDITSSGVRFSVHDGTTLNFAPTGLITAGALSVAGGQRVTPSAVRSFSAGAFTSSNAQTGTGDLRNTAPLAIGSQGGIGNHADMEFYGAAIWRRLLTAAEIFSLNTYFTGRIA